MRKVSGIQTLLPLEQYLDPQGLEIAANLGKLNVISNHNAVPSETKNQRKWKSLRGNSDKEIVELQGNPELELNSSYPPKSQEKANNLPNSPPQHDFKVGDLVTLKDGRGKGRIVDRLHPEPNWIYVDFIGKLNAQTATPYHVSDLKHDLPLEHGIYLLKNPPTSGEISNLLIPPPANLSIGREVRVKPQSQTSPLNQYANKSELVGIIPQIEITKNTTWVIACEKGYRIGLILAEYKYMEMYWVHKTELLPLEHKTESAGKKLKEILETLYLDQESYGYYTNSALRQAHRLVDTNPTKAFSLIDGMIGLPKELFELFDQLIHPQTRKAKELKVPTFISGDSRNQGLIDRLAELEAKRNAILAIGPIADQGVWIEYGKVFKRKFRQAYYRSNKPIFQSKRQAAFASSESGLVKRQYIGEENSKEVRAAGEAIARRNELDRIMKEIKLIESKL